MKRTEIHEFDAWMRASDLDGRISWDRDGIEFISKDAHPDCPNEGDCGDYKLVKIRIEEPL